eukprot:Polyplicarium_translucidae@DN3335_c0_g1_i8.p1
MSAPPSNTRRTSAIFRNQAFYRVHSTLILTIRVQCPKAGIIDAGGFLSRQSEQQCKLHKNDGFGFGESQTFAFGHIGRLGSIIETAERNLRQAIEHLHLAKTLEALSLLLPAPSAGEEDKRAVTKELRVRLGGKK